MTDLDPKAWEAAMLAFAGAHRPGEFFGLSSGIRAYLAALPPSPAVVPAGWKLVPVEADEAMIGAGVNEAHRQGGSYAASAIYRAMLSASPSPPALDGAGRDAVIEECAKAGGDTLLPSHPILAQQVRNAVRALKETP